MLSEKGGKWRDGVYTAMRGEWWTYNLEPRSAVTEATFAKGWGSAEVARG